MTHFLIKSGRCKVLFDHYLLVVFVFSSTLQGRLNGKPIPTTLSSDQDGMMTVEPSTSPGINSGPSMYSRYWIAYASVPFPRLTDHNLSNSSVHGNDSSSSDRRESISSPNRWSDRRQSISSYDQRLSPPFDYGEKVTYSTYPWLADVGRLSSSGSNLRVRSSADSDSLISSWWPIISLHDKKDKDHGSPMILFDDHGVMHRNCHTPWTS